MCVVLTQYLHNSVWLHKTLPWRRPIQLLLHALKKESLMQEFKIDMSLSTFLKKRLHEKSLTLTVANVQLLSNVGTIF